jgi:eukaryotic-like serine/threonine-protein kinase
VEPERWRQVDRLFQLALSREAEQRRTFLDAACDGDPDLRREVEALLAADAESLSLLDEPGGFGLFAASGLGREVCEGDRLGPYRVERKIGEGGMSVVYLARRDDERYERQVAIKLLRQPLAGPRLLARFRTECRILATLDHRNIARLYDAGGLEGGVPYVVMELVDGERIDDYCRRRNLPLAERLRLFRQILAAVGYAHQHLVVHRDLKPQNILVTADGVVKLLDFGIAKLLDEGRAATGSEATLTWLQPMTPQYASPEQLRGGQITAASDVYSLGVLLYQLLAGRHPYRLEGLAGEEVVRALWDRKAPPRPSAVVEGQGAGRALSGDLDAIVLMAMRQEPERRYASVEQLADDLDRHLTARPVRARKSTLLYRAGKFVGRNAWALAAAAAVVALLAGFAVSMAVQSRRVRQQRDRAEQVLGFFTDLFEVANPEKSVGESLTVRELLDRGAERAGRELARSPEVEATMLDTIGNLYTGLGLYERAEDLVGQGLELRRQRLGESDPEVGTSLHHLARVAFEQGDYERSETLYLRALAVRRRLGMGDPAVAETLRGLGSVRSARGDLAGAEPPFREALAICRAAFAGADRRTARALSDLGEFLRRAGRLAEVEPYLLEGLAMRRQIFGDRHPEVAASLRVLGGLYFDLGRYGDAERVYRESLRLRKEIWGDRHPLVIESLGDLAQDLDAQNQPDEVDEAEQLYREAIALQRQLLPPDHPQLAVSLNNLAAVLLKKKDYPQAEVLFREAYRMQLAAFGPDNPAVAQVQFSLAFVLQVQRKLAEAETYYRRSLAGFDKAMPPGHHYRAYPRVGLGRLLLDVGRPAECEPLLREALALLTAALPADHWRTAEARSVLGGCLVALGRLEEAETLLPGSYETLRAKLGDEQMRTVRAREWLAGLRRAQGR